MRIGIIGAGQIGSTLARKFVTAGHEVAVANSRGPETLQELDKELGKRGQAVTAEQAAQFGDLLVVSVPFGQFRELPVTGTEGKTVIDTTNYYPSRDGNFPGLDESRTTTGELMQSHLAQAHVVKAFNAMPWKDMRDRGRPPGTPRTALPYSGDNNRAKQEVAALIDQVGFDPVDAGSLATGGRKHQPGTKGFARNLSADELRAELDRIPVSGDWADAAAEARTSTDQRARAPHNSGGIPSTGMG